MKKFLKDHEIDKGLVFYGVVPLFMQDFIHTLNDKALYDSGDKGGKPRSLLKEYGM